jgi:hypothetical protein
MRQAALAAAATAALLVSPTAFAQLGGISVPGVPTGVTVTAPGGTGAGVTVGAGGVSTGVRVGIPGTGGVGATTGLGLSGVGASAGVGGIGGVSAGIGSSGVSAGVGASGIGGASAGIGTGGVSAGAAVGGVSAGIGTGGLGGAGAGGGGLGGGGAGGGGFGGSVPSGPATTGSIPGGAGAAPPSSGFGSVPSIALPRSLVPLDLVGESRFTAFFPEIGSVSGTQEDLRSFRAPLRARSRLPEQVVRNCREAIVAAALPYGVVRVDAAAAGSMRQARGGYSAPIEFRVVYSRRGGLETRQATVDCRMNTAGRVVAAA